MKYFAGVKTVEELRKKYRELLKKYHPDNENGRVEVTQEINVEYDLVFSILSKEEHSDSQSYTKEENEQFKAIMNAIIGFNITIEVIGSWIWCFDCYSYKDRLKAQQNPLQMPEHRSSYRNRRRYELLYPAILHH